MAQKGLRNYYSEGVQMELSGKRAEEKIGRRN
jgi:hypothetical protein